MKSRLKVVVPLAVTAFFLWLALRGVAWPEVWAQLRGANLLLLGAATLVSTLGIHVRAMRWKVLLAPVDPDTPFRARLGGTAVGFAANNLIPARVGEFARALVCARVARLPVSAVFASLVVERVLDGLVTIGLLFGSLAVAGLPGLDGDSRIMAGVRVLGFALSALAVVLLAMAAFPHRTVAVAERAARVLPQAFRRPVVDALHAFLGGLAVLRSPKLLVLSLAWAAGQWLFLAVSFLLAFRAFGITEPDFAGAVFLQSIVSFAAAIPSSPGFFGTFEAAARYGLSLWGVDESRAISFAIGFHLAGFLSVTLLGLWYAWRLGLSWKELRGSEEKVEEAVERDPAMQEKVGAEPRRA